MGNFGSNHSEYSNKENPNININIKNMLKANASSEDSEEDSEEDSGEESDNDKEDCQICKSREKCTCSEIQIESSKKKRNKKIKVKNNKKENINEHKKIKDSENNEVDPIKNKELGTINSRNNKNQMMSKPGMEKLELRSYNLYNEKISMEK